MPSFVYKPNGNGSKPYSDWREADNPPFPNTMIKVPINKGYKFVL
ncbi:MAG: hypothetical protein ACRC0A_05920 [Chitinophagaceae bacterium]